MKGNLCDVQLNVNLLESTEILPRVREVESDQTQMNAIKLESHRFQIPQFQPIPAQLYLMIESRYRENAESKLVNLLIYWA